MRSINRNIGAKKSNTKGSLTMSNSNIASINGDAKMYRSILMFLSID